MHFEHKITEPKCNDFLALEKDLNSSLETITADTGESSFSREDFCHATDACIVVYDKDKAVACGLFRKHSATTCELKRMYSSVQGGGSYLIKQLESYAVQKGYVYAVLSTRKINKTAVSFYKHHGYKEIRPYGKYVLTDRSICLGKDLTTLVTH